jgi:hypothetical protein
VIEVDRTVSAAGLVSLADQQVGVGLHLAGQRVTLRMEGPMMAVLGHDGTLLRTLACPIRQTAVTGCAAPTAPGPSLHSRAGLSPSSGGCLPGAGSWSPARKSTPE